MVNSVVSSQVTVIITIAGTDKDAQVRYSYTDPVSGKPVIESLACLLSAQVPYYTLFSIDYISSKNGWVFVDITPKPGGKVPSYWLAGNSLALTTYDDEREETYSFNLTFKNIVNNAVTQDDPQESNIRHSP